MKFVFNKSTYKNNQYNIMSAIALSKMNKKQLYDKCKELTADNLSHQLFNNTLKEELQTATNIVVNGEMGSTT